MADRDKTLRIIELLLTPRGQEVTNALADSLVEKPDPVLAYNRAVKVAEKNGLLLELQVAAGLDFLQLVGPILLNMFQNATRKKR